MERAAYRIIDANFNRSREAARVVEEYCRFVLNSQRLTQRAKSLRHELCRAVGSLDAGRLMASRDTAGDVGLGPPGRVANQLVRETLDDCLTAGCKRLTEALRALAETARILNPDLAEVLEMLRFDAYALEKDIVLSAGPTEKFRGVRLYVIITSDLPAQIIALANICAVAGADCIQLRVKQMADGELFAVAGAFVRICKDAGTLSIINDRADIAVAAGADGIHLGQSDMAVAAVRRLQSAPLIIGRSTHSLVQLRTACDEPITYASLGPVFATATKPAAEPVGIEYVRQAAQELRGRGIASVAIGGIGPGNVQAVLSAGADAVAVCSAVTAAGDPAAACRELKSKISAFRECQTRQAAD
ncbi:MAG: thiamine phosphate synthase [Sedimentisphaerales bacterium]|nr:thiamine phosphate synthase [Sedimentisphaerales bacterium]